MKKMLLFGCVAALAAGVASGGERGGKAPLPKAGPAEFSQAREALANVKLSNEQTAKTFELGVTYEKVLADELDKTRNAVREKLIAEVRTLLTGEQKARFDLVMAGLKKRDDATDAADREFAAKLKELRMLDLRGPRGEKDLIQKYFERTDDLRARFKAIKTKCEQSRDTSIALLPPPATDDKNARKSWNDAKDKLEKAAEAQMLEEARNSLTQDQRLALAQAVDALKQWARAVQIAKDVFAKDVEPPPPPPKTPVSPTRK